MGNALFGEIDYSAIAMSGKQYPSVEDVSEEFWDAVEPDEAK